MSVLEFIQKYFIFLLPGIVGVLLYNKINIHKEQHYYLEFIKMILYSFVSFVFSDAMLLIVKKIFPCCIFSPINIIEYISSDNSSIPTANVILSICCDVIFACLLTKANYHNWIFIIANKLKLTRRIDNEAVWDHFFDTSSVVTFRDLVTGNTYYGSVVSYSDNSSNREIYFEDVYVYDKHSEFLYHAEGLYLSRMHNEFTVEIPNDKEEDKTNAQQSKAADSRGK